LTFTPYQGKPSSRREILLHTGGLVVAAPTVLAYPSSSSSAETSLVPKVKAGRVTMSKTIQGYWQLAGGHGKYDIENVQRVMKDHVAAGITSFDTADIYGPSEAIIGPVAKDLGPSSCGVNTKLCIFNAGDVTKESIRSRVLKSRSRCGGNIDALQFFWADETNPKFVDVSLWLSEMREEGLFGELGVTNFDVNCVRKMVKAGAQIRTNQVQHSALDRRPIQSGQAQYCAENDIKLISFGTVGAGILSDAYLNRAKPGGGDIDSTSMRMYSSTASRFGSWELVQELLSTMDGVAKSVRDSGRCPDCNISNIAQRYVLDTDPTNGCLLVGVRNSKHIAENVRTHQFVLEKGEIEAISKVVEKRKGPKGDVWELERGYM